MAENNSRIMIKLSATNYSLWKPWMKDILFYKDLYDPLENKGAKPAETDNEEWKKMNQKKIGQIRHWIGHEGHIKRYCPRYKVQMKNGLSSETASTTVMTTDQSDVLLATSTDGKSDWILNSGVLTTYAETERYSLPMQHAMMQHADRSDFRMADGRSLTLTEIRHVPSLWENLISIEILDSKGYSFETNGGILRVSKGNTEMLQGRKTGGLYRLESNVQTEGATIRHGSNGTYLR
ncbi:hypothetical protein Acr_00g0099730 [Actinidia rufa]|uniref:Retrotransposon Copia-like N-terminal domain-containing protein n=1 Tax=Actinidia rufa TaxID=165716 RepID=A0A7J0DZV1_9ERIC|nr:hypothetical protein Acr_00g0099730 [Actinidia rufa]